MIDLEKEDEKTSWQFLYNEKTVKERAEKGEMESQIYYANKLLKEKNFSESIRYFILAGKSGNVNCSEKLGDIFLDFYENGNGDLLSSSPSPSSLLTDCVRWYFNAALLDSSQNFSPPQLEKRSLKSLYQLAELR